MNDVAQPVHNCMKLSSAEQSKMTPKMHYWTFRNENYQLDPMDSIFNDHGTIWSDTFIHGQLPSSLDIVESNHTVFNGRLPN